MATLKRHVYTKHMTPSLLSAVAPVDRGPKSCTGLRGRLQIVRDALVSNSFLLLLVRHLLLVAMHLLLVANKFTHI